MGTHSNHHSYEGHESLAVSKVKAHLSKEQLQQYTMTEAAWHGNSIADAQADRSAMSRPVLEAVLQLVDLRHAHVASTTRAIQSMAIQVLRADSKHTPLTLLARPSQRGKGRTILQAQLHARPQGQHVHPKRCAQVL